MNDGSIVPLFSVSGTIHGLTSEDHHSLVSAVLDLAITTTKWIVQKRGFHFESLGLSLRDVATDAVAELLSGSDGDPPIIRYLKENTGDSDDPAVIEAHLRAIVVRTINQNITRILAEYDPVYAKSLRMLRIHVRRTESISVRQAVAGCWYFKGDDQHAAFNLPALRAEDLKTHIVITRSDQNPSVQVLEACLNFLGTQSEFRRAVSESDVMRLTLELLGEDLRMASRESVPSDNNHDYKLIEDAVATAMVETRKWATRKYVEKQKLSVPELEAMIGAIRMFILDSADGEPESYFYYLRQHLPALTYERFREDYRNTFQYILRQFLTKTRGLLVSLGYERMDATEDLTGQ